MSLIILQWSINSNFEDAMFYNIMEQGKETEVVYLFFFLTAALHNISWNAQNFFSYKLPLCYWQLAVTAAMHICNMHSQNCLVVIGASANLLHHGHI